jgi:6-phosphofructokinase 2
MIATVTLNPSLDRLLEVDNLSSDDANRVQHEKHYAAGKGIDGSRVIHELGGETIAFGLVGGNNGLELKLRLADEGVPTELVTISGETRVNILLYDRSSSKQYLINAQGPEATPDCLARVAQLVKAQGPDAVIVAGSIPEGIARNAYGTLVEALRGTKVFVDADAEALTHAVAATPWAIKPNRHEASRLLGRNVETEEEAIQAAKELSARGIEHVLLSMGKAGAILCHAGKVWRGVPPAVKAISAVGAGDSMVATYTMHTVDRKAPPEEAFRWALAAGAAVALTPGTELCHRADVERLYLEAKVEAVG